jgi:hypothetical protein
MAEGEASETASTRTIASLGTLVILFSVRIVCAGGAQFSAKETCGGVGVAGAGSRSQVAWSRYLRVTYSLAVIGPDLVNLQMCLPGLLAKRIAVSAKCNPSEVQQILRP